MQQTVPMCKEYSCLILILALLIFLLNITQSHEVQNNSLLLYSTIVDIRFINITGNEKKSHLLYTNSKDRDREITFDFHYAKKKICWTNHSFECIQCDGFDGYKFQNQVENVTTGVLSPDGLAYDWFTNKLYWIDSETDRIEVASVEASYRKVLYWSDLDQPRAIAVVPMKGLIFWTDWGDVPKIERGGMNGNRSTRRAIVSKNISWPNGLSVDYEKELVYWIDAKLLHIESMDYDGNGRKTVVKSGIEYPFAMTQFRTRLYWTDWKTRVIYFYDMADAKAAREPKNYFKSLTELMDIRVWDARRQPYHSHPCEVANGGCSHLCLLAPHSPGYSCACPVGIKLVDNLTCADGHEEILILARRTDINVIYLDSPEYSYKPLDLKNVRHAIAIDYDPVDGYVYWTDDEERKIQRARLDGSDQSDVVAFEILHSDGLAVDWVARNLYWTDSGLDHIEVATLTGEHRRVLIFEDLIEPRAIAVAPELGWLFWTDWNEKSPRIERANLDGSQRRIIVDSDITWPNGIALDVPKMKLYWSDAGKDRIEHANMNGSERTSLIHKDLPHVFGFSLMGDDLYWTDWQTRSVERANKEAGNSREAILEQMPNVMGLKAVRLGRYKGHNACADQNGGCSQLCLYRHDKRHVCACQIDYELVQDNKTCVRSERLLFYAQKTAIRKISVDNFNLVETNDIRLPVTGLKQINAIDFDINNKRIYWSDKKLIMRAYANGSDPQRVVELGLSSPDGIAVDWQAHNIYWADSVSNRIEVARVGGSSRRTLLWRDLYEPHSIVLDSSEGYMYWSEWGQSGSIKKAAMDGTNRTTLVLNSGHALLAIDAESRRLYWTDVTGNVSSIVVMSDLNGLNKRAIFNETNVRISALTVYREFLFLSDENGGQLWKVNKETGEEKSLVAKLSERATALSSWHEGKQANTNHCSVNNGGCSHLCLAQPRKSYGEQATYTCACPTHYTLQNRTCIAPTKFMIYSQRNLAVRLLPDSRECLEAVLPIHRLKLVKAIDFDPVHQNLYWIEGKTNSIKRASVVSSETTVVVPSNKQYHPHDLAVDSLGQLLFWTCSAQDVLNVTRLENGSAVGVVVQTEDEKPRLLAIHPTRRLVFYTDAGPNLQLVRIRMDGSQRIVINRGHVVAALAVDIEADMLVWAQEHTIYMSTIDGDNPEAIFNESKSKVTQLSVHSGYMYWLDTDINEIQRLELKTGLSRTTVLNPLGHIVNLISVAQPNYNHSCAQITSKRCSHICVVNGSSPVCACPHGLALQEDKRTCAAAPDCGAKHFTCSTQGNKDCIPLTWRCDRVKDCRDGSDEVGCPVCADGQFHCQNGDCIDEKLECDGEAQCADQSDEAKCCRHPNLFKCPLTDVCIAVSQLCDGMENCANGADESKAVCARKGSYVTDEERDPRAGVGTTVFVVFVTLLGALGLSAVVYLLRRKLKPASEAVRDQSEDPLNPGAAQARFKNAKLHKHGIPDVVHMSMLNGSRSTSYDRNNITGASSSTNGSSMSGAGCYPRETLNPPPSPATTAASTRGSSPQSRHRPYKHYRYINQPPPPTPCSTDVCDESDYNYPTTRGRYDGGPFPPPPTPRSHCHTESCPPSPGSRSSTYFSPLPPPPSPVASPRSYDG